MNYRSIGKTDISVSEVSLGCWTMGGLNWVDGKANGWANVSEDDITAAIKTALASGLNHFDNADVYGNGRAERMLARILKKLGLKSTNYVIASKMGHFKGTGEHAYHPLNIRHQCEQSLLNLDRDYIDIYYFHHGDFGPYLEEAAATMRELVKEGKVRAVGQSAYSATDFERAVPAVQPDVLQSWAHALDDQFIREGSPVNQLLEKHGMSFVAFSPLAQGLMLDKFDPANPPKFEEGDHRQANDKFHSEFLTQLKPKLAQLKKRFGDRTEDLSAMAQRYILNHPHVACTIPGFRNERQVKCNLAAANSHLSFEDMQFIRDTLSQ